MTLLRCITYLSPSLPEEVFYLVTRHLSESLGIECSLDFETRYSGPQPEDDPDPFTAGEVDLGFMCAPAYQWLRDRPSNPVVLVPAAPVFEHEQEPTKPVYFSEILVRTDSPARKAEDLIDAKWVYNDPCSWSGYYSVRDRFGARAGELQMTPSGSHLNSLAWVLSGKADAMAIDSNVFAFARHRDPSLSRSLRIIEALGPYPIQPIVLRKAIAPERLSQISEALLSMHQDPTLQGEMAALRLRNFSPVSDADYQDSCG